MSRTKRAVPGVLLIVLVTAGAILASELDSRQELEQRQKAAQETSGDLLKKLGSALKTGMAEQGPEASISVCRDLAPQIAGDLSRKNGWRVTRVSSKTRNPMLGMPDNWELGVLADFETRRHKGEDLASMSFAEEVEEGGVRYYRYMKAIGLKPVCLTCHGNYEQIPSGVQLRLEKDYPLDRATGYKTGELRGAVSIKQPMDIPLRGNVHPEGS